MGDDKQADNFASPAVVRWVAEKGWVEIDPPNPMRPNRKAIAARRAHRKRVRAQKRHIRRR